MKLNELELNELTEKIVLRSKPPGKFAGESALRHLKRAWALAPDMPELAVFSAITAEEEAATAIFQALKRLKYSGAGDLKHKDHKHKSALFPFFEAVRNHFAKIVEHHKTQIFFDENEKLRIRFEVVINGEKKFALPDPPLNFNVEVNGVRTDFKAEFKQLVTNNNAKSEQQYAKDIANMRNKG